MGEGVVYRPVVADGVIHVFGETVLEVVAGRAEGRVEFVGVGLGGEAEGKFVGSDAHFRGSYV